MSERGLVMKSNGVIRRSTGQSVALGLIQGLFFGAIYVVLFFVGIGIGLLAPKWALTETIWNTLSSLDGGKDKIRSRSFMLCAYVWLGVIFFVLLRARFGH